MSTREPDSSEDRPGSLLAESSRFQSSLLVRADAAVSRHVEELIASWKRGERILTEDILAKHPELDDEAAIRLVFEEFCVRAELGAEVDPADIVRRFPKWRDELEVLLDCHRLIEASTAPATFPSVGEVFAGFRLLAELGRGASGRIFLAEQPSLADRPVVLKVTTGADDEHLSLARLQHMNIIPLYSEQVLLERGLRVLCMPYLGSATLARVLKIVGEHSIEERMGKHILEAIDRLQSALPVTLPVQGPFRQYLARTPYLQAICWIGACLADGLQYAHDRGLVHMDIKPSNVLLTGDGQPMLLDFHLTRGPIAPDGPLPVRLGGTPEYLSPEQREAMAAIREGRRSLVAVDGRTDLYSLGLVLYEALGGPRPSGSDARRPSLHQCNAKVTRGLSDIIQKCLSADMKERYADAASLAADLRRHLSDLPLRGVPNRSLSERWQKWRRRRPTALARNMILLVSATSLLSGAMVVASLYRQRTHDIRSALDQGRTNRQHRDYVQALRALSSGLEIAQSTPGASSWVRVLTAERDLTFREERAAELHNLAELVRFRYGIDEPPAEDVNALLHRGGAVWDQRKELLRPIPADPALEQQIRADLLDFVLVWTDLRVQSAAPRRAEASRHEAIETLTEANALLGPSPALERDLRGYAAAPGSDESRESQSFTPRTAWEHFSLGKSFLRSKDYPLAAAEFQAALALRPQDFWPNFYLGLCSYRLGKYDDAINAFRVCIALQPELAECYYNRALARNALGQTQGAIDDYARALRLNPSLTSASVNCAVLFSREKRYAEAAAELERALRKTKDPLTVAMLRYNLALVDLARGERTSAEINLKAAISGGHRDAEAVYRRLMK
jgi:serine/threonine protein kinase/tetratricopeptide (TPR) repeat protein